MTLTDLYILNNFAVLERNQKKSYDEIIYIREKKFKKLLKYAYANSPFYKKLYTRNGISFGDLNKISINELPVTDKEMIRGNLKQVITVNDIDIDEVISFAFENKDPGVLYKGKYQIIHSSGSTGTPSVTIYGLKEIALAVTWLSRMRLGKPGKKNKIAYYAGVDGRFAGVSIIMQLNRGVFKEICDVCILDINEPLEKTIEVLNHFQPGALVGYPAGLGILAKKQAEGKLSVKPATIQIGGEAATAGDYALIKDAFGSPAIVETYGASECLNLGIGKEEYNGIYLMDDINYIEIMEDHILVSNLDNYTQPMIRYRINDRLTLKHDSARLLPFRLIDRIIGRDEPILWFKNEKGVMDYIHPLVLSSFCVRGVEKFQIAVKSDNEFDFLAVLADSGSEEDSFKEARIGIDKILEKKEMKNVKYKIKKIDYPIIDKNTKKFRIIVT